MIIVSSFSLSLPLGSGVLFSVYHVPHQPPSPPQLWSYRTLWSQLRFLCFVLGAKWRRGKTLIICLSSLVRKRRDLIAFSSLIT